MSTPSPKPSKGTQNNEQLKKIKRFVRSIPQTPGVYKMIDNNEAIIYIGKAKNLKNRVGQYFQLSKSQSIKVKKMVEKVNKVEYIETESDYEALILETNLIKQFRPRYNVLMRDDKNYVYIKVSMQEDYPRLSIVRKREQDGALYFGPRTSADSAEKTIAVLRRIFPIRTCSLEMEEQDNGLVNITKKTIPIPCLDYHIKRCAGPCIDEISAQEYKEFIHQIIRFLKGNVQELVTKLKYSMFDAAEKKSFEKAAKIRDQIKSVENMFSKQVVSDPEFHDRDVLGVYPDFDKTFINLFQFRDGKLINQENFTLDTPQDISQTDNEQSSSIIESFLRQYYSEATDIPSEIFLREVPLSKENWENWLSNRRHEILQQLQLDDRKSVKFLTPVKGKKNRILLLSEKNAATFARQSRARWMSDAAKTTQACKHLAEELGIEKELKRIECYDISHLGGEDTTASMVVFDKGSPNKKLYRHFKIKQLENGEIDDYKSIEEVLRRRLNRLTRFDAPAINHISIKKPLKKDLLVLQESLVNQHKLTTPPEKDNLLAIYTTADKTLCIGYNWFNTEKSENPSHVILIESFIENDYSSRAIFHHSLQKLSEKLPKSVKSIYTWCQPAKLEDFLSFGFTRLKKIPEFLEKHPLAKEKKSIALIKKRMKKSKDSSFSQVPDLIIIDGGKGQLSTALEIVNSSGLNIPTVGLAKKEEEIFMPLERKSKEYKRIVLPRNSQSLYLVQRIRDESHRFANELRKKQGRKKLTESEIDSIPGVGQIIKRRLLKEYGSVDAIKKTPINQLEKVVGTYIAKKLKEKLGDSS